MQDGTPIPRRSTPFRPDLFAPFRTPVIELFRL
jgi:hypothetical protein